jgi:hypothetical protein
MLRLADMNTIRKLKERERRRQRLRKQLEREQKKRQAKVLPQVKRELSG